MDVPDIQFVGQWRATCKVAVLWQRFGRAARNKALTGTAILFAEKEYFDEERAAKEARRRQREETRKRKASAKGSMLSLPQAKRIRQKETGASSSNTLKDSSSSDRLGLHKSENMEEDGSDGEVSEDEESTLPSIGHHLSGLAGLRNAMAEAVHGTREFNRPQKRRKRELEPAMDYLINAENHAGIECRRKVFDVCFENHAAGEKVFFECRRYILSHSPRL